MKRRDWLTKHQKLLRTLTSYCALHTAKNFRLSSIQMELLLLLLEVNRNAGNTQFVEGIKLVKIDFCFRISGYSFFSPFVFFNYVM